MGMKITKLAHACLDIREGSSRLVIDPGVYTTLDDTADITVLVITHIHQDHFDPQKVADIITANPNVHIFTTQEVAEKLPAGKDLFVVYSDTSHHVGDFDLDFFGDMHATIDDSYPPCQNTAVLVNNKLYYPGDSLTACPKPYTVLAVPTMAPWLKFSDAVPFIEASPATYVFPTHNGFINDDGQALYDRLFGTVCQQKTKTYKFIPAYESIDA
jgi:L-ascorbate metabolism protein UlaG (beta-lactamase superfamily)